MWAAIQRFDTYPKLSEAVQVKTLAGGIVSIISLLLMFLLFCSELVYYLTPVTRDHLVVDSSRSEKLKIYIDLEFPVVPCSLLSMDVLDVSGISQKDAFLKATKRRIDQEGRNLGLQEEEVELGGMLKHEDVKKKPSNSTEQCGDCYGAQEFEGQCCNTCDEVKAAYRKKGWALQSSDHVEQCKEVNARMRTILQGGEGCVIAGFLTVDKAAGNFHVAPANELRGDHDLDVFTSGLFNVSHSIKKFSFGEEYPGLINPLNGAVKTVEEGGAIFQYYIKVVPTTYTYLDGRTIVTNQFSVTEHTASVKDREGMGLPGVQFMYDISPIKVQFQEERRSFFHFLTQLFAIIGGVYTVSSLIDKLLYKSFKSIQKDRIGKFG